MKALAISGSPRTDGNTMLIARHTLNSLSEEGVETQLISLSGLSILGCTACMACLKDERCIIEDDLMPLYHKIREADCVILATPVYFRFRHGAHEGIHGEDGLHHEK